MRFLLAAALLLAALPATAAELDDVNAVFRSAYATACDLFLEDGGPAYEPQVFSLSYRTIWQGEDEGPLEARLYQYKCMIGAYNEGSVFFLVSDDGMIEPLQLAQPTYRVIYARDGDDTEVKDIVLTGMTVFPRVTNASVDPATGAISGTSFWRGLGDASSAGVWKLVNGYYTLVSFDIDGSYDGAVNPTRVWDTEAEAAIWAAGN
jgi:hypothetical protein